MVTPHRCLLCPEHLSSYKQTLRPCSDPSSHPFPFLCSSIQQWTGKNWGTGAPGHTWRTSQGYFGMGHFKSLTWQVLAFHKDCVKQCLIWVHMWGRLLVLPPAFPYTITLLPLSQRAAYFLPILNLPMVHWLEGKCMAQRSESLNSCMHVEKRVAKWWQIN